MAFGISGLGATDPSDFGLGLLNSASGAEDDSSLDTPSLSLSKLGTSFDQEIKDALNQIQTTTTQTAAPTSQEITSALNTIDQKQPLTEDNVKALSDKFKAFGEQATNTAATGGIQSFISLQEALVGLQRLVEDYASKDAAAAMGSLFSKTDSNSPAKKFMSDAFEKWSRIDFFAFGAVSTSSDESKREKTREIQYMMFISLQVTLKDQDPMLQSLRESPYIHEAGEQCGPNGSKAISSSSSPLSASEQLSIPIQPLKS